MNWHNLDFNNFFDIWHKLSADMKRVGDLVGVKESFLVRAMRGTLTRDAKEKNLGVHQRFYAALALHDLVTEVPIRTVAENYQTTKGTTDLNISHDEAYLVLNFRNAAKSTATSFNICWHGHCILPQVGVHKFGASPRPVPGSPSVRSSTGAH